ncbi:MAG: CBS domain-containing protein [Bacteroidia bacterium]
MKTVKEIMFRMPGYCEKNESLHAALEKMSRLNIGSLPVVDKNKKVVGIITNRDVCLKLGKTDKSSHDIKVHEVMTENAFTCRPDDETNDALKIMRLKKVHRLPVVDALGKLQGLLTLNTIIHWFERNGESEKIEYQGEENVVKTLRSIAGKRYERAIGWE